MLLAQGIIQTGPYSISFISHRLFTHSLCCPQFCSLMMSYILYAFDCKSLLLFTLPGLMPTHSMSPISVLTSLSQLSLTSLVGSNFSSMWFHSTLQLSIALITDILYIYLCNHLFNIHINVIALRRQKTNLILLAIVFLVSSQTWHLVGIQILVDQMNDYKKICS